MNMILFRITVPLGLKQFSISLAPFLFDLEVAEAPFVYSLAEVVEAPFHARFLLARNRNEYFDRWRD